MVCRPTPTGNVGGGEWLLVRWPADFAAWPDQGLEFGMAAWAASEVSNEFIARLSTTWDNTVAHGPTCRNSVEFRFNV